MRYNYYKWNTHFNIFIYVYITLANISTSCKDIKSLYNSQKFINIDFISEKKKSFIDIYNIETLELMN